MVIHVVQLGETIEMIARKYGVSVNSILVDNELKYPYELVTGQTLVILFPVKTYTVKAGDTIQTIASGNGISLLQLLRNNAFLAEREFIYPGEILVIQYNNNLGKVKIGGFAYPYINQIKLRKTLPYLTYLSIFNYSISSKGKVITYYDDDEIVEICKAYGVAPLMLLTTLSVKGVPNIEAAYDILTDEELQDQYIISIINLIKSKGYYGVNISFQYFNIENQSYYINLYRKISLKAMSEGIPLFITVSPYKTYIGNVIAYEKVDYSSIKQASNDISFLNFNWGHNFGPPVPVGSIDELNKLIDYVVKKLPPSNISIGLPVLGYDWELPYVVGFSSGNALTLDSVLNLARNVGAVIEFDVTSQTPYFFYMEGALGIHHIIWFIDARSINSLMDLVRMNGLQGTGIWNIMDYYSQMWLVINSQYEIEKLF